MTDAPRLSPRLIAAHRAYQQQASILRGAATAPASIPPNQVKSMATLSAVAARIKAKKIAHQAKADQIAARLDALDQLEPHAFAAIEHSISGMETDLGDMESEIRALSNGSPLAESPNGASNG